AAVPAVFRHDDARRRLTSDARSPWNEPGRQIGIPMKRENEQRRLRRIADDVRIQWRAVGCDVLDARSGNAIWCNARRLKYDAFLIPPEQYQRDRVEGQKRSDDNGQ